MKLTYMKLVEELASRGHQITMLSSQKPFEVIPNVKEIFTYDFEKAMEQKFDLVKMKESGQIVNPFGMVPEYVRVCEIVYDRPEIQALMREKFDLILMQPVFNDCAYGVVHKIKAPLVLFAPTSVAGFLVNKVGGYFPTSFVPNIFLGYSDEMTFVQRFINFGTNLAIESVLRLYYEPAMTDVYRRKLNDPNIPDVREIAGNASLILSNGHFSLSGPKPFLPDVVDVGGIHSVPAKPLPKVDRAGIDTYE
jgi:glucuronosyltransferase